MKVPPLSSSKKCKIVIFNDMQLMVDLEIWKVNIVSWKLI